MAPEMEVTRAAVRNVVPTLGPRVADCRRPRAERPYLCDPGPRGPPSPLGAETLTANEKSTHSEDRSEF